MTTTINAVYDLAQYDLALEPVHQELVRRRHIVRVTRGREAVTVADASICIQDVGVPAAPRPRFFITHGASCVKGWDINFPIDFFLAPTAYWAETLAAKMARPAHAQFQILESAGWPRMDLWTAALAAPDARAQARRRICDTLRADPAKPIVVYAPTYEGLQDDARRVRPFDGMQVLAALESIATVLVVPHQMEKTADFAGDDPRILRAYGRQRITALIGADLLIGDRSGLVFEFTAADRPIVLINPTDSDRYLRLESNAAGELFDVGPHVSLEQLPAVVLEQLAAPAQFADRRRYWRDKVVGPCDGQHAARCVDAIERAMGIAS